MFKISWGRKTDPVNRTFALVGDVDSLFELYHIISGYGREDGVAPVDVEVTNLDGRVVPMDKGTAYAAAYGTYGNCK
jgi:hypothetical protein